MSTLNYLKVFMAKDTLNMSIVYIYNPEKENRLVSVINKELLPINEKTITQLKTDNHQIKIGKQFMEEQIQAVDKVFLTILEHSSGMATQCMKTVRQFFTTVKRANFKKSSNSPARVAQWGQGGMFGAFFLGPDPGEVQ